jgi:hypothetical protein
MKNPTMDEQVRSLKTDEEAEDYHNKWSRATYDAGDGLLELWADGSTTKLTYLN